MAVKVELVEGSGPKSVQDQSEGFDRWTFRVHLPNGEEREVFGEIPSHMELTILAEKMGTVTDFIAAHIQRMVTVDPEKPMYRMPDDRKNLLELKDFLVHKDHLQQE